MPRLYQAYEVQNVRITPSAMYVADAKGAWRRVRGEAAHRLREALQHRAIEAAKVKNALEAGSK